MLKTQTIAEAEATYKTEERTRLKELISFLAWECAENLEDAAAIARGLYFEAQKQRAVERKSPLPDLNYFGL